MRKKIWLRSPVYTGRRNISTQWHHGMSPLQLMKSMRRAKKRHLVVKALSHSARTNQIHGNHRPCMHGFPRSSLGSPEKHRKTFIKLRPECHSTLSLILTTEPIRGIKHGYNPMVTSSRKLNSSISLSCPVGWRPNDWWSTFLLMLGRPALQEAEPKNNASSGQLKPNC